MKEVISLFVTFIVVAVLYEYMKPKDKTDKQKDLDEEEN